MTADDILTIEQVAKIFQMKPQTIYKWAEEGIIPGVKLGKEWRFRKKIIDEWFDTALALSKGGFEFMLSRTWLGIQTSQAGGSDLEELMKLTDRKDAEK